MKLKIIIGMSFVIISLKAMQHVPSLKQLALTGAAESLIDRYANDEDLVKEISKDSIPQDLAELLALEIVSYRSIKNPNLERLSLFSRSLRLKNLNLFTQGFLIEYQLLDSLTIQFLTGTIFPI